MEGEDLRTERLILRPLAVGDAVHIVRLLGEDSAAVRMMSHMPDPCTGEAARSWIEMRIRPGSHTFAILLREAGAFIGAAGFAGLPDVPGLGYWIGRPYRRRGYAAEAVRAVLDHARSLGVRRMEAETFPDNPASARVLANAGFARMGSVSRDYPDRGGRCELEFHVIELGPGD